MRLDEYFDSVKGIGVLATADAAGKVNVAIYSRPHFLGDDDREVAFIMNDRLSHDNVESNPHAAYLFIEEAEGYVGKRLFLTKTREETDHETIQSLRRRNLPAGCDEKVRLFIKEPKSDGDETRSQAFLGEDWAKYTPLFAPLDLYVGVAQHVKVERFTMQPEGGPNKVHDVLTCPRHTIDGKTSTTEPRFRDERTRFRYRLQNFKTENGDPVTVPLTIHEHVDGEWIIEKIVLKELEGERTEQQEKEIPHADLFTIKRIDVDNVEFEMQLPPTTIDKKYDLYVTILRKNRRY